MTPFPGSVIGSLLETIDERKPRHARTGLSWLGCGVHLLHFLRPRLATDTVPEAVDWLPEKSETTTSM